MSSDDELEARSWAVALKMLFWQRWEEVFSSKERWFSSSFQIDVFTGALTVTLHPLPLGAEKTMNQMKGKERDSYRKAVKGLVERAYKSKQETMRLAAIANVITDFTESADSSTSDKVTEE